MLTRRRIGSWFVVVCLIASQVLLASPAEAGVGPNASMFFYKPGHAMTGVLKNGTFTKKSTFTTGTWTAAAVSRDSLALYNKTTGKLVTGTFRGGHFHRVATTTIATGFARVVAGCWDVAFYKTSGVTYTATFSQGHVGPMHQTQLMSHATGLVASCDTLMTQAHYVERRAGTLGSGYYSQYQVDYTTYFVALMTASMDSYLLMSSKAGGHGAWGSVYAGNAADTDEADGFGPWDILAASADSILFYRRDGTLTARGVLKGGNYSYVGKGPNLGAGWRIIAGGR